MPISARTQAWQLSAALAGYSFGQFGSLLVNLAAHRHPAFVAENSQRIRPVPIVVPV